MQNMKNDVIHIFNPVNSTVMQGEKRITSTLLLDYFNTCKNEMQAFFCETDDFLQTEIPCKWEFPASGSFCLLPYSIDRQYRFGGRFMANAICFSLLH